MIPTQEEKSMKKLVMVVIAFALLLVAFSACGNAGAPQTIKVGVNAELTGSIPAVGKACKNAAEMAVKEINDAGGLDVGGTKYKVELFTEDNEDKSDSAVAVTQKLITQQNVVAVIGPNASRNAIPAAQAAESAKVPLISPWSTNAQTTQGKKYVFRAAFIDPFQGRVVAKFALNQLNAKKAAVLYDISSDYNKGIAEVFQKEYQAAGGQVVGFESYSKGDKDFTSQLTKIKGANPDVIFLPNYYAEVPLQVQQAHKLGINVPFVGSDSWGDPELIKLCGNECEGFYYSTHYAPDNATPVAKKFIDGYKEKYGEVPNDVAALTYDSFGLLWTALKNAGKVDRQAVRDALAKIPNYEGVTGKMQFNEGSGDPVKSAVILQIKGQNAVYFGTAEP